MSRLDEQQRRWFAALESQKLGYGGDTVLALVGPAQPETELSTLEAQEDLVQFLTAKMSLGSKRKANPAQIRRLLAEEPNAEALALLRAACGGDDSLTARIRPYWGILRTDLRGGPLVYLDGAVYVTGQVFHVNGGLYI